MIRLNRKNTKCYACGDEGGMIGIHLNHRKSVVWMCEGCRDDFLHRRLGVERTADWHKLE